MNEVINTTQNLQVTAENLKIKSPSLHTFQRKNDFIGEKDLSFWKAKQIYQTWQEVVLLKEVTGYIFQFRGAVTLLWAPHLVSKAVESSHPAGRAHLSCL